MHEEQPHNFEPLIDNLSNAPPGSFSLESPGAREEILRRTSRIVYRRRQVRRLTRMAQFAAMYVAGAGTVFFLTRQEPRMASPQATIAKNNSTQEPHESVGHVSSEAGFVSDGRDAWRHLKPWELRDLVPNADRKDQLLLLQLAGDRYLQIYADISGAVLCYQQYLEIAGPENLVVAKEDSWLLADLKFSRRRSVNL